MDPSFFSLWYEYYHFCVNEIKDTTVFILYDDRTGTRQGLKTYWLIGHYTILSGTNKLSIHYIVGHK